jgi:hypothetical protein
MQPILELAGSLLQSAERPETVTEPLCFFITFGAGKMFIRGAPPGNISVIFFLAYA